MRERFRAMSWITLSRSVSLSEASRRPTDERVSDDQKLLHIHRIEDVGDGDIRDPGGAAVGLGVDRQPVPALVLTVDLPMPRVVDEKIVLVRETLAKPIEGREDLVAVGVE